MLLVGANSSWRPGACSPLYIANRRQETAPTKRYLRISSRLILQSKIKPNLTVIFSFVILQSYSEIPSSLNKTHLLPLFASSLSIILNRNILARSSKKG